MTNNAMLNANSDLDKRKLHSFDLPTGCLRCLQELCGWKSRGHLGSKSRYGLELADDPPICGRRHENDVVNDNMFIYEGFIPVQ
jgi:hypothetical protein